MARLRIMSNVTETKMTAMPTAADQVGHEEDGPEQVGATHLLGQGVIRYNPRHRGAVRYLCMRTCAGSCAVVNGWGHVATAFHTHILRRRGTFGAKRTYLLILCGHLLLPC